MIEVRWLDRRRRHNIDREPKEAMMRRQAIRGKRIAQWRKQYAQTACANRQVRPNMLINVQQENEALFVGALKSKTPIEQIP